MDFQPEGANASMSPTGWCPDTVAVNGVVLLLARDYRVIAPDLRGFGDSATPVDGYDKNNLATDLRARS